MVIQRIGQDVFRDALMNYWGGRCPLTGITEHGLLRASHIVPWADCNDAQRLAACRTEVHSAIANDVFAGADGHRMLDRIQRALLWSPSSLRLAILGCI